MQPSVSAAHLAAHICNDALLYACTVLYADLERGRRAEMVWFDTVCGLVWYSMRLPTGGYWYTYIPSLPVLVLEAFFYNLA